MNPHLIALAAHLEVYGMRAADAAAAVTAMSQAGRRWVAAAVRRLPRARRAAYWAARQTGMYPVDALMRSNGR